MAMVQKKMQSEKTGSRRQLLVIAAVLGVFCVSLFIIRFVNAKSHDKQVRINKKSITLTAGNSQKWKVRNLPGNAKVTWKSSKKSVVSVSKKGRINAKKMGKATIQCKIIYGRKKKKTRTLKCKVTVAGNKKNANSVVYMTKDISPEGLMAVYKKLNWNAEGKVAVKVSTGEPPASNYLDPDLIKDLVQSVDGTIVECNTAYGGDRSSTALHRQVAKDHGFTRIAEVDIMDSFGSMTLPVKGGTRLKKNYLGKRTYKIVNVNSIFCNIK